MITKAYDRARFECDDVLAQLQIISPINCCDNCVRVDPSTIRQGVDYARDRQIIVHPTKPDNGTNDWLIGLEIVTCCNHLAFMRSLTYGQWDSLARSAQVGKYAHRISSPSNLAHSVFAKNTPKRLVKTDSCEFCGRSIPSGEVKCPVCFPRKS